MRNTVRRIISIFGFFAMVGIVAAVPAGAVTFTINGGVPEAGGITTPCSPCTPPGATGIPVGTQGYVALNPGQAPTPMTLNATTGTIIFRYLGSDAALHNQFLVDFNRNGFDAGDLVFDNRVTAFGAERVFSNNLSGPIPFEYIFDVGGSNTPVSGNPSTTFGVFLACVPNAGNPRGPCSEGYIGLADGTVFNANDDHQDLGVQFRTPEPGTLSLLGAGLLGLGLVTFRRRKV